MAGKGLEAAADPRPADPGDRRRRHAGRGFALDLHVVVEYGLNLAEVAATVRSRVAYEVERLTGLPVAAVEVHIEDVQALRVTRARAGPELARGALATLEANRAGSTTSTSTRCPTGTPGTNLTLTVAGDRRGARRLDGGRPRDAREGAHARGADGRARQLGRDPLPDRPRRRRGARRGRARSTRPTLARAFRGASDAAYRAVRQPVEGTMLTVIRELAEEAERPAHAALAPASCCRSSSRAARTRSRGRRSCSPCCARRASSTRAGPACSRSSAASRPRVAGEPLPDAPADERTRPASTRSTRSSRRSATARSSWSRARASTPTALERELERLGDSLLVVGDATALKVHVHTDDPGAALALGTARRRRSSGSRSRTCTSRPSSARSGCSRRCPIRPTLETRASSRSSPGAGNRRLFESSAPRASSRAARR